MSRREGRSCLRYGGSQMSPSCDLNVNNKQYLFNVLSRMENFLLSFRYQRAYCLSLLFKQPNTCKIASNICNDMWQCEHNFLSFSRRAVGWGMGNCIKVDYFVARKLFNPIAAFISWCGSFIMLFEHPVAKSISRRKPFSQFV